MNRVDSVAKMKLVRSRRSPVVRALLLPALCSFVLVACGKEHDPVTGTSAGPRSAIAPLGSAELIDPAINPADSYLVTTAVTRTTTTVESAEPFVDPLTGQQVNSLTFPDVVDSTRFEAGYDAAGTVRLNEFRSGTDSGGPAARVVIVGNTATFYDGFGAVVHDTSGPILMDALGSMDNVIVTSEAVLRDDSSGVVVPASGPAPLATAGAADGRGPRTEKRGDRLFKTYPLDDVSSGMRGERVRQFRKSGREWIVVDERIQATHTATGFVFNVVETTVYPTVKWKTNEEKDAQRRARSAGRETEAPHGSGARARPYSVSVASALMAERKSAGDANAGAAATSCLLCAEDGGAVDTNFSFVSKPTINVAYQHGAFADSAAWLRMDSWLSLRFNLARKLKRTSDWRAGLESQSVGLNNQLIANGGSRFLLIGHSNGGLIARRVAQFGTVADQRVVGGVVAIAAPHFGLPLVRNTRAAVSGLLSGHLRQVLMNVGGSCGGRQFSWLCEGMNDALLTLVPNVVNYAFDQAAPMSRDVMPGSAFTSLLNATPEPFLRYSVEVESQGAWKFVRMLGDWKCNPEDRCSGDHLQNTMESVYDVLRYCGSNELAKALKPALAERCRSVRWSLNNLNSLYERLTAPGDASDGLVPAKSQAYPGLPLGDRELMKNAKESHVGELKSPSVRDRVTRVMNRFNTQTI